MIQETLWLQVSFACTFFGIATIGWGMATGREKLVRGGLLALMATALAGIPLYYNGLEIIEMMESQGASQAEIDQYELDYTTNLTVCFFQGFAGLMIYLIQKSLQRPPKFFLFLLLIYSTLAGSYLAWQILN